MMGFQQQQDPIVGLQFQLKYGQAFFCTLPLSSAANIINTWTSGEVKNPDGTVEKLDGNSKIALISIDGGYLPWAVQVDAIQCIHAVDPAQLQQLAQAQQARVAQAGRYQVVNSGGQGSGGGPQW